MKTFKALGALLIYPSAQLKAALPEIEAAIESEGIVTPGEREEIKKLVAWLRAGNLYDLQEVYTSFFDRTRSLSLHLYEHVHGEARERGQAMVRLQTVYALHGFSHVAHELPDYLPLLCEFLSEIPERAARSLLGDAVTILEVLRERLARRESSYAAALAALIGLASKCVDPKLLEALSKGEDGDEAGFDSIDAAWAEEPVTFGPGARHGTCAEPPAHPIGAGAE